MKRILPPVLAWLVSRVISTLAAVAEKQNWGSSDLWLRWDSGLYLDIAKQGYTLGPCDAGAESVTRIWCGNSGWFPGYPWLIELSHRLGMDSVEAAASWPGFFCFVFLALLWFFWISELKEARWLTLFCAANFPGAIYYHAGFPISMFLAFSIGALTLVLRGKILMGALISILASVTYSTGFLLGGVFFLFRKPRSVFLAAIPFVGFISVLWMQYSQTGIWGGFFKIQSNYGYSQSLPFTSLFESAWQLLHPLRHKIMTVIFFQTVLVASLAITAVWKMKKLKFENIGEKAAFWSVVIFWSFPHLLGKGNSLYRSESLLVLGVIFLPKLNQACRISLALVFVVLHFFMSRLFFRGVLI